MPKRSSCWPKGSAPLLALMLLFMLALLLALPSAIVGATAAGAKGVAPNRSVVPAAAADTPAADVAAAEVAAGRRDGRGGGAKLGIADEDVVGDSTEGAGG